MSNIHELGGTLIADIEDILLFINRTRDSFEAYEAQRAPIELIRNKERSSSYPMRIKYNILNESLKQFLKGVSDDYSIPEENP